MDRCDADQEGQTLPPTNTIRMIARDEANRVIVQHLSLCPLAQEQVGSRLRALEGRVWLLIGVMFGSGAIGGVTGATLVKLLTP